MSRQEKQGSRQSPRRRRRERKQQKKLQKQKKQKQKGNATSWKPQTAVEIATSNAARLHALARRGRIAVSHTNAGNLPFARNWFASLMRVGVPNWAIFATDEEAYDILHAEVPNHVLRWHNRASGPRGSHFAFRSKGWTRVVFAVPRMARFVLELGLAVLWIDTDIVELAV